MANRHLARSVALQVLFERDASEGRMSLDDSLGRLAEYAAEFGARESDMPFMQELIKTAVAKQREIDTVITKAAPEWPLEKIAAIDRNILRLGLTELFFADSTQGSTRGSSGVEACALRKTVAPAGVRGEGCTLAFCPDEPKCAIRLDTPWHYLQTWRHGLRNRNVCATCLGRGLHAPPRGERGEHPRCLRGLCCLPLAEPDGPAGQVHLRAPGHPGRSSSRARSAPHGRSSRGRGAPGSAR
jgi:N utilization substance protein B